MATRRQLTTGLSSALEAVAAAIRALPADGMLIGGIAVILRGVPRATRDIDATISGGQSSIASTLNVLRGHDLVPRIADAEAFAAENQVILLRHEPSRVEVDLSLAWLSFEEEAIARADELDVGGVKIRVARPEDLIIYKAVAWRPQDRQDIERLIVTHGSTIDQARVLTVVRELAESLDEPERVDELRNLFQS